MNYIPESSLFLGIIPALILLYIPLKHWHGEFKEKTLFLVFIIGIVIGFLSAVIEIFSISVGILSIIMFPLLEQLFKTMVLNIRRFQEKRSTVLYGLALGLGFGSIFTPVSMLLANTEINSSILVLLSVLIGSIGIIFIQGSTGVIIGYGIYQNKLTKYFLFSLLFHIVLTFWFFLTGYFHIEQFQVGIIVFGIFSYIFVLKKYLDPIIKQREQRKRTMKST